MYSLILVACLGCNTEMMDIPVLGVVAVPVRVVVTVQPVRSIVKARPVRSIGEAVLERRPVRRALGAAVRVAAQARPRNWGRW